jgi:hypothetical protein
LINNNTNITSTNIPITIQAKVKNKYSNKMKKLTNLHDNSTSNHSQQNELDNNLTNTTSNTTHPHDDPNSISSEEVLYIIANQSENIKNEICSSCLEINKGLNVLIDEIKQIKSRLKNLNDKEYSGKFDLYSELSHCINNINLIKAELFRLNNFLDTLQKANCKNYQENSKKYSLVVNSTNKLLEVIQNVVKKLGLNINLVILN